MANVADIAKRWIGATETGSNTGEVVSWTGASGLPWCAAFVTQCHIENAGGIENSWLKDLGDARFSVDAVISHGQSLGLNSNISETKPAVGSLLSFTEFGHIGMVTAVKTNENGETVYEVTHGNYSDKVVVETFTEAELATKFHNEYVDSRKIDQYHAANGMNVPPMTSASSGQASAPGVNPLQTNQQPTPFANIFGALPTTQQVQNDLQNNGSLTNTYDQYANNNPAEGTGMEAFFLQMLVAIVLSAANQQSMIPTTEQYQQNPNAGREALENADRQRQNPQLEVSDASVNQPLTPSATPSVQPNNRNSELVL